MTGLSGRRVALWAWAHVRDVALPPPSRHHLIGAEQLATMKDTAYLVNTARGPTIDEAALALALRENQIAGAGLDVSE